MTSLFFLGVFLTFAPGPLILQRREAAPPLEAILFCLVGSGLCGVLWALAGGLERRLFPVAAVTQLAFSVLIGSNLIGSLAIHSRGIDPIGALSVALIAAGYTCFVVYIAKQGTRAVRYWSEMELAGQIHRHLVPPVLLRTDHLDVAGMSEASSAMGGDLVDAAELSDGSVEVVLADVSGHGVRSGVLMAMIKALLCARRGESILPLSELLGELNRVLADLAEPGMFATLAIARVRPDGRFEYANAGHPPLLVRRPGGCQRLDEGSMPLGVAREETFASQVGTLAPRESLILYSDGLVELPAADGRQLGFERFAELAGRVGGNSALPLLGSIVNAVRGQARQGEQLDDQSAVVLLRL